MEKKEVAVYCDLFLFNCATQEDMMAAFWLNETVGLIEDGELVHYYPGIDLHKFHNMADSLLRSAGVPYGGWLRISWSRNGGKCQLFYGKVLVVTTDPSSEGSSARYLVTKGVLPFVRCERQSSDRGEI